MRNLLLGGAGVAALCVAQPIIPAHAEIGSPAKPGGFYVSVEGGYQQSNAPGVATQGDATVVPGTTSPASNSAAAAAAATGPGSKTSALAEASSSPPFAAAAALASGTAFAVAATARSGTASATEFTPTGGGFIAANQGAYGSISAGYVLPAPVLFLTRIEAYETANVATRDQGVGSAFGLLSVDNHAAMVMVGVPPNAVAGDNNQRLGSQEFGLRFKADTQAGPVALAYSLEPFYINYQQYTTSAAQLLDVLGATQNVSASRAAQVTADLYGAQFALEGVLPVSGMIGPFGGQASLIGRGSAGLYSIHSTGNFASVFSIFSNTYAAAINQQDNSNGYRLGGEGGVRYAFSHQAWLSFTAGVDYFSALPTGVLPRETTDPVAHIGYSSLLDWHTGVRLTLSTP